MNKKNRHTKTIFNIRFDVLVCLFLVLATLAVYWQIRNHEFLLWDDGVYVTENTHVTTGLSLKNISWAFTTDHASNWHPITWMSHMLDVQLYGMKPGRHHLTNLLIHIFNTLLLFLILTRMTGKLWQSGFVAALFSFHPLHVESVAWLAERKDVLSTFFWLLTIGCYTRYVEQPGINRYVLVLICFVLGLMSKPMLVTLPFVLLLLDYWPLNRLKIDDYGLSFKWITSPILLEKLPLFVLAAASSVVTFMIQQRSGAVGSLNLFPLDSRISNALVSYVNYIWKMLWPFHLAFFYPHPMTLPRWQVTGACLLLLAIFFLVIWRFKRYPWLAVGWLWYVGTLVPVIGLVQVGEQSMADRYTYVPLVGLFIIIAWGFPELVEKWHRKKIFLSLLVTALFSICLLTSWRQVGYWKNNIMVYAHALDVTAGNYVAHNNLGLTLAEQGNITNAIHHYTEALKIKPGFVHAYNNLGAALAEQGQFEEAIRFYNEALRLMPRFAGAHHNLGVTLAEQGKHNEAIIHYNEALRIEPNFIDARNNLGYVLVKQGRLIEAENAFREVLRMDPGNEKGFYNLKEVLEIQKKMDVSIEEVLAELNHKTKDPLLHYKLGNLYKRKGELDKAIEQYQKALSIKPVFVQALNDLAITYAIKGNYDEALSVLKRSTELQPDDTDALYLIASIYARQKETEKSIEWLKQALQRGYNNWNLIKTDHAYKRSLTRISHEEFI
jgi:tetratricopeptide (TPR) repeat protein